MLARIGRPRIDKFFARLLAIVFLSALLLVFIDFYAFRITSAARAYVNGESEYSKGQKDALVYLFSYINLEDDQDRRLFKQEISVPMADNNARNAFYTHAPDSIIAEYFLEGKNNQDDVGDMIWLFKTFQHVPFFAKPVAVWKNAEPLINQLNFLGDEIYVQLQKGPMDDAQKNAYIKAINNISARLSAMESQFSSLLGETARMIRFYLFITNLCFIVLIITSIVVYANTMIKSIAGYAQQLKGKISELTVANKELDVFIFSASHDLRSPIASVKGLVDIAMQEGGTADLQDYLQLVKGILDKQDNYIKEIIDFFKSKRGPVKIEPIDLKQIAEEIFALNRYIPAARGILFVTEINLQTFNSDALRIRMVLNNLVSNAIKYSDKRKMLKQIFVRANQINGNIVIEVEDNGIGIDERYQSAIFELFFVKEKSDKNTGIGLYIVKQSVDMLGGKIAIESEINSGTKFILTLPVKNLD